MQNATLGELLSAITDFNESEFGPAETEMLFRVSRSVAAYGLDSLTSLESPDVVSRFLVEYFRQEQEEKFGMIFLNNKHQVLHVEPAMFIGTIDGACVHPRLVVKEALNRNAAHVIIFHNHPSGHSEPSQADRDVTVRLKKALELIDVKLLDHLVLGSNGSESFSRRGWL